VTAPQSVAASMLSDAPGLVSHPGLVAALQSGRATSFQVRAVQQFVDQLELNKQVVLARQSGAHLNLSPADKQLLDGLGVGYNDVDAARTVQHPPAPQEHPGGFWHSLTSGLGRAARGVGGNVVLGNPVVHGVLHGLDRAGDTATGAYRVERAGGLLNAAGVDLGPLNHPVIPGVAGAQNAIAAENQAAMPAAGYDSHSFFDVLAFYSHGEQVFSDLSPLRDQYGDQQVNLAARYVQARGAGDTEFFQQLAAGKNAAQVAALQQQLNDPRFQEVVRRVDSAHLSPGRDFARGLGIDPVAHSRVFTTVSGSVDAAATWFLDPTIVLGKAHQAYKAARIGLDSAIDGEGVRRILDPANRSLPARQVQRGFGQLLDDAQVVRTGSPAESAAALARINGRTPELVPLVGDITGQTRVLRRAADGTWVTGTGPPITTMDELTAHLVDTNALLRLSKGFAAAETPLMPGAVSRYGYRALKGAAAGKATERGLQRHGWIDVREDPARLIPTPGDSAGSTVADDVAEHLTADAAGSATSTEAGSVATAVDNGVDNAAAAARGTALLNERRYGRFVAPSSRAGRSLAYFSPGAISARFRYGAQRLTNLLPSGTDIVWASPDSTDFVRRFALTYMPKSEANLLAAQYAAGDEAARMAIARGVLMQAGHAAGLPASVSGRMLMDRMVADATETYRAQQVYSPVAGADTYLNPHTGRQAHGALWDGQLDTGIRVPAFAEMQKVAAKATVWDHTMRTPLSSQGADDIMSILKPLWLLTGSNVSRNVLEDWAGSALRGQGLQLAKARSAVATRRILTGAFDDPVDARSAIGRAAGHAGNAVIIRHLRGLKASAHLAITDADYLAALQDLGTPEVDGWLGRLAGDAHKAILSPGEADVVDEITKAGYQVRDMRVKLEPGGYDAVPADGGKGARAWSANLAARITGSGIGEHAVAQLLDPSISRETAVARHAEFLGTDAATEFRERAQRAAYTKAGVPVVGDPELRGTALHDLAADQLDDMHAMLVGRDGNLIEPLAQYLMTYGRAPTAEWIAAHVPDEMRPAHAIGRTWTAVAGGGTVAGVKDAIRSAGRSGYEQLIERPIEALSRNPIFLINHVRARRSLAGYADHLVEQGIERPQAEAIARSTMAEQAFHATVAQVDNPELRTQMDVVGRNFFTFSRATQDFLRRWGRTFREDPSRLRKAQLVVEGGVHSGFITKDDQGSYQFTYPGSGAAMNALISAGHALRVPGMVMLPVQPNLSTKLIYLNAGLDNPVAFTVSPLVSTPVAVVEGLFPGHELGKADLDVLMRGQLGAGRPQWESYMPTVIRRFWAALDGDTRNSQTASAVRNAIMHMDAAGLTPPADATPAQRDEYLQRVRTGARTQLLLRGIFATFAPGAPSQPEEATAGDAADPFYRAQGIASLQDELRLMIGQYGYQKAAAVWMKLHPDKQAFLESASETAGKSAVVPATRAAEQFMQHNKAFLQRYGTVGGYFIPTDPGEFSQQAWQAQLEMGLRTRKDVGQFYTDVRVRGAEKTYYDALDKRDTAVAQALAAGDNGQAKAIKEGFRLWSEQFQAYNPLFAEKQSSYNTRVVQAEQALAELRQMLGDPGVPALPDLPGVQAMVDAYAAHTQFSAQLRGQRSPQATAARDGEASAFGTYMKQLVGQYPGVKDLYNGLFRTLDNDLDYVAGG
jgi:hypothetical protein